MIDVHFSKVGGGMYKKFKYAIIITIIILAMANISYADKIAYFPPYPKDINVFITMPEIGMKLKLNGNTIETFELKVDGKKVDANYDKIKEKVYYKPTQPLSNGQHTAELTIYISDWSNYFSQSWNFTVNENAINSYPSINESQQTALEYVNQFRNKLGLSNMSISQALNAAANAHTNYMIYNSKLTHNELPSNKGYSGGTPFMRAKSYGYNGIATAENVASGIDNQTEALDAFIEAPYHRLAWLNPFAKDFGYASKSNYHTVLFGTASEGSGQVVTYPQNNQKKIPIKWENTETPNPLDGIDDSEIGFPITISYFSERNVVSLDIKYITLKDVNKKVKEVYLKEPENDQYLSDSLILIPKEPLKGNTKYYVSTEFNVIFEDGTKIPKYKSFSFTTKDVKTYAYNDISNHWAVDNIEKLANEGVLSDEGSYFYPDKNISRGDFCKYIVKVLNLPTTSVKGDFTDVPESLNSSKYIEAAKENGIVYGYPDGTFRPTNSITREELAVIIKRVYELEKENIGDLLDYTLEFSDATDIQSWALEGVKLCNKLKIINGRPKGVFDPQDKTTRAEAVTMIIRLQNIL